MFNHTCIPNKNKSISFALSKIQLVLIVYANSTFENVLGSLNQLKLTYAPIKLKPDNTKYMISVKYEFLSL